ncbi:MAG: hypothetical protein RLZZ436_2610, partial [Planctomycetota bacterium]
MTRSSRPPHRTALLGLTLACLAATGCGGSNTPDEDATAQTAPAAADQEAAAAEAPAADDQSSA